MIMLIITTAATIASTDELTIIMAALIVADWISNDLLVYTLSAYWQVLSVVDGAE